MPFVAGGAMLGLYALWALTAWQTQVFARGHSVVYLNPGTQNLLVGVVYVVVTCGAMFMSGYRCIVAFGAANFLGLLVVFWAKEYAFTSVWCAYAAVVSGLIYGHFYRRRKAERAGKELLH